MIEGSLSILKGPFLSSGRKKGFLALILSLFFLNASAQSVLISEVADPGNEYQARYVELYNPTTNPVDISGWSLRRYANGNNTSCDATIPASTTIPAGGTYVIARDASVFNTSYSCSPDKEDGCITGNGNDVYELFDGGGVVDVYGEVGVDGSGEPWEYEDAIAVRQPDVCSGNTTWTSSEWNIIDPGNTGDATPCSHTEDCSCSHSISSFSPNEGCPDTGTVTVTINGSGFTDGTGTSDVQFGGVSSPNFTVISDSEIEAEVPSGASSGFITVVTDACSAKSGSIFTVDCPICSQLFVNEFSNGNSGNREYVELIVGNDCGDCTADLRGWIVDDNNGVFSGGANTGEGIAQGHVRFDPNGPWGSIPTGSIIVIYNDADENYSIQNLPLNDDPYDADNDSVYVIPVSNTDLQECTDVPSSSDDSYAGCSYTNGPAWDPISMSNSQDAMQTREPNGDFFHGASYGNDGSFTGGPDGLHVHNSSGTGDCFFFGGTDPRDVGNWTQGDATADLTTTDESPGSTNNSSNATYVDNLACSTLPIQLLAFEGRALEDGNRIRWRTASEVRHERFELQRSPDAKGFKTIKSLDGKGQAGQVTSYRVLDREAPQLAYYRLKSIDLDGSVDHSRIIALRRKERKGNFRVRKMGGTRYRASLPDAATKGRLQVHDRMGRKIRTLDASGTSRVFFELNDQAEGLYFLHYRSMDGSSRTLKFFH